MENQYDVEEIRLTGELKTRPHGPILEILRFGNIYRFTGTLKECKKFIKENLNKN